MVQVSKISTINNQSLSFNGGKHNAAKKLAEITCQHMYIPGTFSCIRVLQRFPNGTSRATVVPTDFFITKLLPQGEKGIRSFLQKIHDIPSKNISRIPL